MSIEGGIDTMILTPQGVVEFQCSTIDVGQN